MPFLGKTPAQIVDPEVDIDGGSIDGATIGATSASAATVTTFTSTGIDDNATSTAITIDASENVGIGTIVPDRQLQVESATAATFALATTKNSNSGDAEYSFGEFDFLTDDSVGGINTPVTAARIAARAKTNSSVPGGELAFYTNISGASQTQTPIERMRILSSGGITFNGDTAAANALDDYEEGTWTPQVTVTEGPAEGASPSYSGTYTKIGNRVYATATINLGNSSDVFAVDDRLSCGGLPFTSQRSTISGVGTGWAYSVFSSGQNCFWHVGIGTGAAWWAYCTHLDGAVSGNKVIEIEFSYPTGQ